MIKYSRRNLDKEKIMLLLSSTLIGGLYLILLFGLCFSCVVGIKAINSELKRKNQPPEQKPEQKPEKTEVYYLVEKKRTKKRKKSLQQPKQIEFKK